MDDFEMEELDHVSELYDEIDRLRATIEELEKEVDAVYQNQYTLEKELGDMTAERDAMIRSHDVPMQPSMIETMPDHEWHSDEPDDWNINAGKVSTSATEQE